ncbi:DUF4297 domain-containing protein [Leptospira sp. 2 VSF19]|uniref:DUF4297 domain-containing protein n=1 Tax=Leptospira soteropolitanensis TaxID=2950025 RepID=A0AAW5VLM9_9LEPT|nr:dsDNA nuclease domain-containing protein [Leptospira soteropolitanensis]MCW7492528.1 DUF4297 domain-containing protein [Leptospira soteropolitanensis]MCW7500576.1 DUF4297 domain-containing protein [Leptospira soteropolitanensis]MCW7522754.1 DUF4297 domain-containing protein [Leptospira soteropolitanensis]MCW7526610.1 DUF4297 domain-containing protein [Leptospira soteropolitanensis]MCW7530546.1 DUF4297 domain-containing protein [Leptospira soteropolitanensis]
MKKNIKNDLVKKEVREKAGAMSSNRFDFQKDWVICKLIELNQKDIEFAIIMEHHEDVVAINPFTDPQEIHFFQIKTSKKNWTLNSLIKKDKEFSILGKIANTNKHFPYGNSFYFCSNKPFAFGLKDPNLKSDDFECIPTYLLDDKTIKKLKEKLPNEGLSNETVESFISKFSLIRLKMEINTHAEVAKAMLIDHIDKKHGEVYYRPGVLYNTIFDEVKRKTNYENSISNFDDLITNKGITSDQFTAMIQMAISDSTPKIIEIRNFLQNKLNSENAPLSLVATLLSNLQTIYMDRKNQPQTIQRIHNEYFDKVETLTIEEIDLGLWVNIKSISANSLISNIKSKEYIFTLIGLLIYEKIERTSTH